MGDQTGAYMASALTDSEFSIPAEGGLLFAPALWRLQTLYFGLMIWGIHLRLFRIPASIVKSFPSLLIFVIYHLGDRLPSTIFNVVVENFGQRVMMLCRLCHVVGTLWFRMRRVWLIPR